MRCLTCKNICFSVICKDCTNEFLKPQVKVKKLDCGLTVVSFFDYGDIELLIQTKYKPVGYFVFNFLAKHVFGHFIANFSADSLYYAIPIDDTPSKKGYSHTAILAKALKCSSIKPVYNVIRAQNRVEYAGKSRDFRLNNPRNFKVNKQLSNIILVDDVVTTGSTLGEAYYALNQNVDFALTLCW